MSSSTNAKTGATGSKKESKDKGIKKEAGIRIKWNDGKKNEKLLEIIKLRMGNGIEFEKPNAAHYYRKLHEYLMSNEPGMFAGVTEDKLNQHMKDLKSSYDKAKAWKRQTGEGVTEEDQEEGIETVDDAVKKICKYYDELHEILKKQVNQNEDNVHDSGNPPPPTHDPPGTKSAEEDDKQSNTQGSGEEKKEEAGPAAEDEPLIKDGILKRKVMNEDLLTKKKKAVLSPAEVLENGMKFRAEADKKRLDFEERKYAEEKEERGAKLGFEKEKWNKEAELRSLELANDKLKIEKDAEVEQEKAKLNKELEIEKLKLQHQFELEKLRLQGNRD